MLKKLNQKQFLGHCQALSCIIFMIRYWFFCQRQKIHMHPKINKISRGCFCKEPFNWVLPDLLNGGYWYLIFSNSMTAVILSNVRHLPFNYLFFVEPTNHFFLVIGAPLPWGSILPASSLPHRRHDEESIKYSLRQVQYVVFVDLFSIENGFFITVWSYSKLFLFDKKAERNPSFPIKTTWCSERNFLNYARHYFNLCIDAHNLKEKALQDNITCLVWENKT